MSLTECRTMNDLHLITVQETASRELTATGAKLFVLIAGQSFFTGTQAFKKAEEVAACVAALKKCGVSEDQITLLNVSTQKSSGLFSKSSAADYKLKIVCESVERLGEIIAAISSQKNADIARMTWEYDKLRNVEKELVREASSNAKDTATVIARSLGVNLLGAHRITYDIAGRDTDVRYAGDPLKFSTIAARYDSESIEDAIGLTQLELSHTTRLAVHLRGEFLIDRFEPTSAAPAE